MSRQPQPQFQALTVKHNGRAGQIITDLKVSAPYDPKAPPQPLPAQESIRALWDTGASKSVISQGLAKTLNLTPVGATNVNHAGGASISPTHLVNFYMPHGPTMLGVLVTEFPGQPRFDAIVGMDIIALGDFAITNVGGETVMTFRTPSMETIDFVAAATRQNAGATGGARRSKPRGPWRSFK